jgi:hypothetical protein
VTEGPDWVDVGEDRRKHFDFIQSAVGRMSSASNVAKGWCLTVATATFGFALSQDGPVVALLGVLAALLFGLLDARYLREERKFRALYEEARRGEVAPFDMRTGPCADPADDRYDERCSWRSVIASWSVWAFYGPLLLVGAGVFVGGAIS